LSSCDRSKRSNSVRSSASPPEATRGINGGAFFFVRLPKTGLEVDVPIIAQFPRRGVSVAPDSGMTPDVIVTPTIDEIAAGTDAEMRCVMRLIGGAK